MNAGVFLYTLTLGLCAGVAAQFLVGFGIWFPLLILSCAVVGIYYSARDRRSRAALVLFAAALAAGVIGVIRADMFFWSESQETLVRHIGETGIVEGVVEGDPDRRETSLHLTVDVVSISGVEASGKILALVPRDEQVVYGDRVRVRGPIAAPQAFESNGGREFDYPGYLRAEGISAMMSRASLVSTSPGRRSLQGDLFWLKHSFERSVEKVFVEPQGALLEGIILGERRGVPPDITNTFIVSGLIHVVVLSGYNITIVADAVLRGLRFLPRAFGFSLGGVLMILFALMTGGGATTLRAVIMALIAILARYLNRPTAALRALALAVMAMVLWNPIVLLYSPSFILSVLATFGLITLSPWIEAHLLRARVLRAPRLSTMRSIAASTIAVQLFVLPALLYFTGVLSFVSLPANILALPAVPGAMLFGFLAGLLNFVSPMLAFIPGLIGDLFLRWIVFVAQTAAAIPLGSTVIPAFSAWIAAAAYIPLGAFAIRIYRKNLGESDVPK